MDDHTLAALTAPLSPTMAVSGNVKQPDSESLCHVFVIYNSFPSCVFWSLSPWKVKHGKQSNYVVLLASLSCPGVAVVQAHPRRRLASQHPLQ